MFAQRRDTNEIDITAAWQRMGCTWWPLDRKDGADGLLFSPLNGLTVIEIKRPDTRNNLTPNERKLQGVCQRYHAPYAIVTNVEEALTVAGYGINE